MIKQEDLIRIREAVPADAAGIAHVHVDSWRSTYRGIVPAEYLASLDYDDRTTRWKERLSSPAQNTVTLVAEMPGGKIVGFAAGGPNRGDDAVHGGTPSVPVDGSNAGLDSSYDGELYAIYLPHEYLGRGIGRMLTAAMAKHLVALGMQHMIVWVLTANPARRFYEALGAKPVSERTIAIGGAPLPERSYGWRDIAWFHF